MPPVPIIIFLIIQAVIILLCLILILISVVFLLKAEYSWAVALGVVGGFGLWYIYIWEKRLVENADQLLLGFKIPFFAKNKQISKSIVKGKDEYSTVSINKHDSESDSD